MDKHATCCQHQQEVNKLMNRIKTLENKIWIVQEENKVLKSLLQENSQKKAKAIEISSISNNTSFNMSFNNSYLGNQTHNTSSIHQNTDEFRKDKQINNENSNPIKGLGYFEVKLPPPMAFNMNNLNDISANKENIEKDKKNRSSSVDPCSKKLNFLLPTQPDVEDSTNNTPTVYKNPKKSVPRLKLEMIPNYHGNYKKPSGLKDLNFQTALNNVKL